MYDDTYTRRKRNEESVKYYGKPMYTKSLRESFTYTYNTYLGYNRLFLFLIIHQTSKKAHSWSFYLKVWRTNSFDPAIFIMVQFMTGDAPSTNKLFTLQWIMKMRMKIQTQKINLKAKRNRRRSNINNVCQWYCTLYCKKGILVWHVFLRIINACLYLRQSRPNVEVDDLIYKSR